MAGLALLTAIPVSTHGQSRRPTLELLRTLPSAADTSYFFGHIADFDLLQSGDVVVADGIVRHVLRIHARGGTVDTIGRSGRGPGEFRAPLAVQADPNGWIAVADVLGRSISVWNAAGEFVRDLPVNGTPLAMWWRAQGLTVKIMRNERDSTRIEFQRTASLVDPSLTVVAGFWFRRDARTGRVDGVSCEFCPATVRPNGRVLVSRADTSYEATNLPDLASGDPMRLLARSLSPVAYSDRERAEIEERLSGNGHVPTFKPTIRAIDVDETGVYWVLRSVPDGQPSEVDLFSPGGTFLTTIRLPVIASRFTVRFGRLLVATTDDDGEPRLLIFAVRWPRDTRYQGGPRN